MDKVTLVATCEMSYGGRHYGAGMQFVADPADAAELVKAQQAKEVPPEPRTSAQPKPAARAIEPDKP